MYETVRIVGKLRPKYVVWENVKNVLSKKHKHNFDNYLNAMASLGYKNYYQVLNAKDYGVPQNRERVFTISIRNDIKKEFIFPPKQELYLRLKDMLEDEVEEKYYLSQKLIDCFSSNGTGKYPRGERFRKNINRKNQEVANSIITTEGNKPTCNFIKINNATKQGYQEAYEGDSVNLSYPNSTTRRGRVGNQVAQTLQCNDRIGVIIKKDTPNYIEWEQKGKMQHECRAYKEEKYSGSLLSNNKNKVLITDLKIRKLTPRECFRLMGFTDSEFDKASVGISNTQLYKMAGNSIVVNVLVEIFRNLFKDT